MDPADPRPRQRQQAQRLKRLIEGWVRPFSAYYRERLPTGELPAEDLFALLDAIPVTTKRDVLAGDPLDLVLQPSRQDLIGSLRLGRKLRAAVVPGGRSRLAEELNHEFRPVMSIFTTGRTSAPLGFHLTRYDIELLATRGKRMLGVLGLGGEGTRGVSVFPYAPHLAFWQTYHGGVAGGLMLLHTGGGRCMGTVGILSALARMKPAVLLGIPGYTYHVLRQALEEGMELPTLRHVVLGGEAVGNGYRRRVRALLAELGAPEVSVKSVYGLTEVRSCFAECDGGAETGFHIDPETAVCEVLDPETRERRGPGEEGEVVFTPLDGRGSVSLRYATGDIAVGGLVEEPCPACGQHGPRLIGPIRRRSDRLDLQLDKVKGTLVDLGQIGELLSGVADLDEWHLTIGKRDDDPFETDQIRLEVALRESCDAQTAEAAVRELLKRETELSLDAFVVLDRAAILERVGMEELLKERRITDLRPRAGSRVG